MTSPPTAMHRNNRPQNQHFHHDEYLFRRVPEWIWHDPAEELGIEAVELPESAKVYVVVPGVEEAPRFHIASPRLARPERAVDFVKEVTEEPRDAGL